MKRRKFTPSESDWQKCFELRCRTKRGERIAPEEQTFVALMWKADPARYSAMGQAVFEATKPVPDRR